MVPLLNFSFAAWQVKKAEESLWRFTECRSCYVFTKNLFTFDYITRIWFWASWLFTYILLVFQSCILLLLSVHT